MMISNQHYHNGGGADEIEGPIRVTFRLDSRSIGLLRRRFPRLLFLSSSAAYKLIFHASFPRRCWKLLLSLRHFLRSGACMPPASGASCPRGKWLIIIHTFTVRGIGGLITLPSLGHCLARGQGHVRACSTR